MRRFLLPVFLSALPAFAQLSSPTAIPKGPNPPVVFLNGYQSGCPVTFSSTFGSADAVLSAAGIPSVYFDNCSISAPAGAKPTLEAEAAAFATFVAGLKYSDGTAVTQFDAVAHSMGGLILRAYLAGKQDVTPARFAPPVNHGVRKAVFLATPHFGTKLASTLGNDEQTRELSPGSQFLLDLNTWNAGYDDLRGVDAIAVAGNAGNGRESDIPNFDDGVVTLNSASLGFARTGRTRVIQACHTPITLLSLLCPSSAPNVAFIKAASDSSAQIMISFLTGTNAWQSIGTAVEDTAKASDTAGLLIAFQDAAGTPLTASSVSTVTGSGTVNLTSGAAGFYQEALPARTPLTVAGKIGAGTQNGSVNLQPAASTAFIAKPGPLIHGVVPAGSAVFPYAVTAGAYVAVYGNNFTDGSTATAPLPYPQTLGGVTVTVSGQPVAIQFVSSSQINMIFPSLPPGSATLVVSNALGKSTATVVIAAAVPSIFSINGFGTEAAAAINALSGTLVTTAAPLKAGVDYVELFLTGLGATTPKNGLDYADAVVTLSIGGKDCPVTYAGRVSGVPALDQVNCQIPAGLSGPSVPVTITAAGRPSNTVTLAIQ